MKSDAIQRAMACLVAFTFLGATLLVPAAEKSGPRFQTTVDMVVVTFTVTDNKGNYVVGLHANDIIVLEDGVVQTVAAFAEGRHTGQEPATAGLDRVNVFVLFDTSNWMYTRFPYACDAITEFVRELDVDDFVAIYKFSRNLFRAVPLTNDRHSAISGVRTAVVGDDTALFNAMLLTLRDAARAAGRKALVVFSNGPDNASIVSPSDVGRVAEDAGIPIYLVSTGDEQRSALAATSFKRLAERTGGRLYWAESWRKQSDALRSVDRDLAHSYTLAYYPAPNPNTGFRRISVNLASGGSNYSVRARAGYSPLSIQIRNEMRK